MGETKRLLFLWFLFKAFLVTLVTEETTETNQNPAPVAEEDTQGALSKLRLPRKLPSIIEIKRKLPSHCFERKASTSLYYAFKDFAIISALYVMGELMWNYLPWMPFMALTPVFWFLQGTMFTAVFVVGHDCGHSSFSESDLLNDTVGTVMHTFIMAPFYGWKVSHKNHHKNTGNIDKDEVFYPVRKSQVNKIKVWPFFGFGISWFAYLLFGYKPRPVTHLNPLHPIYRKHVFGCIVSLVAMATWGSCLYSYTETFGFSKLCYHYIVPDFIYASYIVLITFLHHTEDDIPWYADHLWSNVRGQLSTVDRHYGIVHDVLHNISTHQIHHLFPKVPHYHLEEATRHFRKEFPELVNVREERIFPAFFRMFKKYAAQKVIGDETEVYVYK